MVELVEIKGDLEYEKAIKGWFVVTEPMEYIFHYDYCGLRGRLYVKIRPGFVTDFPSIPAMFTWLVDPTEERLKIPSVVHDAMFNHQTVSYKFAAGVMDCLMRFTQFKQRNIVTWAVKSVFAKRQFESPSEFDYINKRYSTIYMEAE